jgi:hypothetical protein
MPARSDADVPSGFFLTETPLPDEHRQLTSNAVQRITQELEVLHGFPGLSLAGKPLKDPPWPPGKHHLDSPDLAEALDEAHREFEAADEARHHQSMIEARAALIEVLERHDDSAERERRRLHDYLEDLRARVEEPGLSFSDEAYSHLVNEGETAGTHA